MDNISAFSSSEYDIKIKRTLSYYDDFYEQVIELVKVHNSKDLAWLDVGCGTGKMGSVAFENFAPFTDIGKRIGLEKWRNYQISQGKSSEESEKHIQRYGKDYFPITLTEHMELMQECGFKVVEILWLSNMQVGIWGMK